MKQIYTPKDHQRYLEQLQKTPEKHHKLIYAIFGVCNKITEKQYYNLPPDWKTTQKEEWSNLDLDQLSNLDLDHDIDTETAYQIYNNTLQGLQDTLNNTTNDDWHINGMNNNGNLFVEKNNKTYEIDPENYKIRDLTTIIQLRILEGTPPL